MTATTSQKTKSPLLSSQYVNGIYIPCALLVVGIAILRIQWVPYAVAVAAVLGSIKASNNRK